jgi:octanoyl-[GcvH]:protein N-octanoyltransferase
VDWKIGLPDTWRLLDGSPLPLDGEALFPFAVDELECRHVGKGEQPFIHIWRHRKAFILGLRDRKLQGAHGAMEEFSEQGYAVAVRNSGGAAVPLDEGVVNISLILPNSTGTVKLHRDFAIMASCIKETVYRLSNAIEVDVGEITGSYCPGAFDLAVGGRKFCGIAQRRQTGAYIVQAFIVVEGVGAERARAAADFYSQASGKAMTYPQVTENHTTSLQEVLESISVEQFVQTLKAVLLEGRAVQQVAHGYGGYDKQQLDQLIAQLETRYNTYTQ